MRGGGGVRWGYKGEVRWGYEGEGVRWGGIQPHHLAPPIPSCVVAGVLYIHVHSASNLPSQDLDGLSDPYCVILANKAKVSLLRVMLTWMCVCHVMSCDAYLDRVPTCVIA